MMLHTFLHEKTHVQPMYKAFHLRIGRPNHNCTTADAMDLLAVPLDSSPMKNLTIAFAARIRSATHMILPYVSIPVWPIPAITGLFNDPMANSTGVWTARSISNA